MKEKGRLNQLFDYARSEKPIVDADRIDALVASGKKVSAKKIRLGRSGRGFINPLNLIIMFSIVVSIVAIISVLSNTPDEFSDGEKSLVVSHQSLDVDSSFVLRPSSFGGEELSEHSFQFSDGEKSLVTSHQSLDEEKVVASVLKDTLIIGEVIHLTQSELTKLGFLFNEDGFFYCNKDERGYLNFYSDKYPDSKIPGRASYFSLEQSPNNLRKDITNFSFHPGSITGLGGERQQKYFSKVQRADTYRKGYYDDMTVPVYFPGRWYAQKGVSDKLVWFYPTVEFFDLLPEKKIAKARARIDMVKKLREIPGNETKNYVDFNLPGLNSTIASPLIFGEEVLLRLGFRIEGNRIIYKYEREKNYLALTLAPGYSFFDANGEKNDNEVSLPDTYNSILLGVTIEGGGFSVAISTEFYQNVSDTVEFFSNMYDASIPIRFEDDSLPEIVNQSIFWFYPTEEFFNKLPDSIGIPMRKEYRVNVKPVLEYGFSITKGVLISDTDVLNPKESMKSKPEEPVPCQYFKSFCEGLPGLDNLKVYPNPTSGELNLEILLSEGKTIDYRIFDLSGRLMVDDVERKKYDGAGRYNQKMDLGHLENGFYLLVLTDEGGARMTRRVVKN